MPGTALLNLLAAAMVGGDSTEAGIVERLSHVVGRRRRWMRPLVRRYLAAFANRTRPRLAEVEQFLLHSHHSNFRGLRVKHWLTEPQRMQP